MSFYKITDPKERRRMFEKLTQTRKNVQEQFLADKIGKIESSQSLKKFFKPVTESQRELIQFQFNSISIYSKPDIYQLHESLLQKFT